MRGGLFQGPEGHRNTISNLGKFPEIKNVRLSHLCKDLAKQGLELVITYTSEKLYPGKKTMHNFSKIRD